MSVPSYFSFQSIVTILIVMTLAAAWAVALRDALRRPEWDFPAGPTRDPRTFWIAVVLLLNVAGAALYYLMVMRQPPQR